MGHTELHVKPLSHYEELSGRTLEPEVVEVHVDLFSSREDLVERSRVVLR
jgi:hypothetical protein